MGFIDAIDGNEMYSAGNVVNNYVISFYGGRS